MKAAGILAALALAFIAYLFYPWGGTDLPAAPTRDIYVADFARMVEDEERQEILGLGGDMDSRFGAQVVVVTIDTLDGEDIDSYANRLFNTWGIGDAEKNNGVLLLIARDDRKFRIEVGYGLEGAITDSYAGTVLDGMAPRFRAGDYSAGILEAYKKIAQKVYDEYGAAPPANLAPSAKEPAASAGNTGGEYDYALEWWEEVLYSVVFIVLVLVFVAAMYFFVEVSAFLLGSIIAGLLWYILNVLAYVVSLGRWGSLDFVKCYQDANSRSSGNSRRRSSRGRSSIFSGFGGGRSGGGGSSGGW